MRSRLALVVALLAVPGIAASQNARRANPGMEIGIRGGWMRLSDEFSKVSMLSIPVSVLGPATGGVHATVFVSPTVAIEPQFAMIRVSDSGDTFTFTTLAAQVMGFLAPDARRAPYVFGHVAIMKQSDPISSETQQAFGGGVGYRVVVRQSLGIRYEARWRQWSGGGTSSNEIALLIGLGAVLGEKLARQPDTTRPR
jgi:hypothetical protein